jgi:rubrerythrin
MTVQREIERARAIAEAARGNYLLFAEQTEDETARRVYREMAEDMERHTRILESRLDYLEKRPSGSSPGGGRAPSAEQPGRHPPEESKI